jgi:hypothetical protein
MRLLLALLFCSALAHLRCDPDSGFVNGIEVGKTASRAFCEEQARRAGTDLATLQQARSAEPRSVAMDSYMSIYFKDYQPAPCSRPGVDMNQFQALGVTFSPSSWSLVNECGNYGVSSASTPNMIISPSSLARDTSLTFSFSQQVSVAGYAVGVLHTSV